MPCLRSCCCRPALRCAQAWAKSGLGTHLSVLSNRPNGEALLLLLLSFSFAILPLPLLLASGCSGFSSAAAAALALAAAILVLMPCAASLALSFALGPAVPELLAAVFRAEDEAAEVLHSCCCGARCEGQNACRHCWHCGAARIVSVRTSHSQRKNHIL